MISKEGEEEEKRKKGDAPPRLSIHGQEASRPPPPSPDAWLSTCRDHIEVILKLYGLSLSGLVKGKGRKGNVKKGARGKGGEQRLCWAAENDEWSKEELNWKKRSATRVIEESFYFYWERNLCIFCPECKSSG